MPGLEDLLRPQVTRVPLQNLQGGSPSFIQRLTALLQRPGVSEGLIATGSGLLAQSDQPGTLGGALGRALPGGVQAGRAAARRSQFNELLSGISDPNMRNVLSLLGPDVGGQALASSMLKPRQTTTLAEGASLVDATTGDVLAENAAAPDFEYRTVNDEVLVFSDGELVDRFEGDGSANFTDVSTLRREFNSQIADIDGRIEAFRNVEAAATGDPTPARDISLIFAYMKTLDPNSSVREGEFATAQNAGSAFTVVGNLYNRMLRGERLNPTQRAEFLDAARDQVRSQVPIFESRRGFYTDLAQRNDFNVSDVVRNPFEGLDLNASAELADPLGIRR